MNRSFRDSLITGKNFPISSQHRRGLSLNGASREPDDHLDLFSKSRRSVSVASSDETDGTSFFFLTFSSVYIYVQILS